MSVYEFLKENQMLAESFDPSEIERVYFDAARTRNTLEMITSYYVPKYGDLPKENILTIDAGGTNLRFAFYQNGQIVSENRMPMFGTYGKITADEFFDLMAAEIDKYDTDKVGFSFAYVCEILPDKDARIISFTKEIEVEDSENRIIGQEINKRLSRKRQFAILNDTVAAQLGVCADAAIILGTGFNISYFDKSRQMIIDTESGQYKLLPEGVLDKVLNKSCIMASVAEKQISGAYLGRLIRITAEEYFGRKLPDFELSDVSEFMSGGVGPFDELTSSEKDDLKQIVTLLMERAANRIAIMLKVLLKGYEHPSVALEGSTVYKLPGYFDELKKQTEKIGLSVNFVDARNTITLGCIRSLM